MDEKPREETVAIEIKLSKGNRKKANVDNSLHGNTTKKTLSICLLCRYMRNPRRRI